MMKKQKGVLFMKHRVVQRAPCCIVGMLTDCQWYVV